jgi:hypothetical protein
LTIVKCRPARSCQYWPVDSKPAYSKCGFLRIKGFYRVLKPTCHGILEHPVIANCNYCNILQLLQIVNYCNNNCNIFNYCNIIANFSNYCNLIAPANYIIVMKYVLYGTRYKVPDDVTITIKVLK